MERLIIYALVDPRTEEIRYVGKSTKGLQRPRAHAAQAKTKKTHSARWIKSLQRQGLQYGIEVLDEAASPKDLELLERWWIKTLRSKGARLTNLTDGGEGSVGYRHTAAAKRKMRWSEARREDWRSVMIGKKPDDATRAKMSKAQRGRKLKPEAIERLRSIHLGRKRSTETKAKLKAAREKRVYKPLSDAQKKRISESLRGRKKSEATKERMRLAQRARYTKTRAS